MPLYLVTGAPGSGKSSVIAQLKRRGYESYDADEAGPVTAKWHNDQTGCIHPKSSVKAKDRTPEFIKTHSWKVPRQEVEDLARRADSKIIFLCSVNDDKLRDFFKSIFALVIDDETLKSRLEARTTNDWGKHPHELKQSLEYNHKLNKKYQAPGYVNIDATQPLDKVVDEILSYIKVK